MSEEVKVRIQDDLFEAVNGEWLKTAVIPDDKPSAGGFSELDENVEKILMADFKAFADGSKTTEIAEVAPAVELYKKVLDTETRNSLGVSPVLPSLKKIKQLKSMEDLNKNAYKLVLDNVDLPFNCGVEADMKNATKNAFIVLGPSTILPDTSYYQEGNPVGPQLLEVYKHMAQTALAYTNLSKKDQKQFLEDTIKFDALVAKRVKSQLEWAEYTKCYNPMPLDEVAEYLKPFDFKGFLANGYKDKLPETIIVYDPRAIKEFKEYFSEETFSLYVHWAYVQKLLSASQYLSEELASNSKLFRRTLMGVQVDPALDKQAYQLASRYFPEPIGVYYGRTYFGEEAKKDVVNLVKKIIATYKKRVKKNAFLEENTKAKAILKLNKIVIKMGYPDKVHPRYKKYKVDSQDNLYVATQKLYQAFIKENINKLYKPYDRKEWAMPGHMVNACYNPSANDITFPAAILQKPFYSINQTVSQNLGGIGAVIGHEISHAFDNNGAQFDENGNLFNWWSENDYKEFQKLTQEMIEQFDGIDFHGGKVNGKLIVSENIADNGGVAVTLEIMKRTKDASYEEYFMNWGKIWCRKAREEYIQYLLANDVHAPAELRANIQPRNFKEWYKTFNVTRKDKMYIAPAKRIVIW